MANAQQTNEVAVTATYRERMALPDDAVLDATLEDISSGNAPGDVIARKRLKRPGQPPFRFLIPYDPSRIIAGRTYSVSVRITAGPDVLFTTDRMYPVLTSGHGKQVSIMLARNSDASRLGVLPATFSGELPCADCAGIEYVLNLFPNGSFFLRKTYRGRGAFDDAGAWRLTNNGSTLVLRGNTSLESFEIGSAIGSAGLLHGLDQNGRKLDHRFDLRRMPTFQPIEPRLKMSGMFGYMGGAAVFTECRSGQRWPVSTEGAYRTLKSGYLKYRRNPEDEFMVDVAGQIASKPGADDGKPLPTLVVERYLAVWPGETCGDPSVTTPLEKTRWRLTRIGGKPVIVANGQRGPYLILSSGDHRVTGFGGCNAISGAYTLHGNELAFRGVASTAKACFQGMDVESKLLHSLGTIRRWKILGNHLELYDANGKVVARFEAGAR